MSFLLVLLVVPGCRPAALSNALEHPEGKTELTLSGEPDGYGGRHETQVSTLPDEIGTLEDLRVLRLNNNTLTDLPASIANLEKLELLDLRFNRFERVPDSVLQLPNLYVLYLGGNPLSRDEIDRTREALPNTDVVFISDDVFDRRGEVVYLEERDRVLLARLVAACLEGEARHCVSAAIHYDGYFDSERAFRAANLGCPMEEAAPTRAQLEACWHAGMSVGNLYPRMTPAGRAHALMYFEYGCEHGSESACYQADETREMIAWSRDHLRERQRIAREGRIALMNQIKQSTTALQQSVARYEQTKGAVEAGRLPSTDWATKPSAVDQPAAATESNEAGAEAARACTCDTAGMNWQKKCESQPNAQAPCYCAHAANYGCVARTVPACCKEGADRSYCRQYATKLCRQAVQQARELGTDCGIACQ